jgi:hypothetical protein
MDASAILGTTLADEPLTRSGRLCSELSVRKLRWNWPVCELSWQASGQAEHLKVIQHPVSRCEKVLDSGLYSRE